MSADRPQPGAYPTLYPYGAFYPCPWHPLADTVAVLVVTEWDAYTETPCCVECGVDVVQARYALA